MLTDGDRLVLRLLDAERGSERDEGVHRVRSTSYATIMPMLCDTMMDSPLRLRLAELVEQALAQFPSDCHGSGPEPDFAGVGFFASPWTRTTAYDFDITCPPRFVPCDSATLISRSLLV